MLIDKNNEGAWRICENINGYFETKVYYFYTKKEAIKQFRQYFDRDKWKRDAKMDGRGHSLNGYDGSEEYATINKVDFYIYRNN